MIARNRVFVVPACLDATPQLAARRSRVVSAGTVDAPAWRGDTRGLCRACTAAVIGRALTGADSDRVAAARASGCADDREKLRPIRAVEARAAGNDCGAGLRSGHFVRIPTLALETWRRRRNATRAYA